MWTVIGTVASIVAAVIAAVVYVHRSSETEVDLKSATSAVAEARERVLAMEAAEAEARRLRIEAVNARAAAATDAKSAADLLHDVTNRPGSTSKM